MRRNEVLDSLEGDSISGKVLSLTGSREEDENMVGEEWSAVTDEEGEEEDTDTDDEDLEDNDDSEEGEGEGEGEE